MKAYIKQTIESSEIKTQKDYQQKLEEFYIIINTITKDSDTSKAEVIANLIDQYENKHFPIKRYKDNSIIFPENTPRTCPICNGTGNKFHYFSFRLHYACDCCNSKGFTTRLEDVNYVKNRK